MNSVQFDSQNRVQKVPPNRVKTLKSEGSPSLLHFAAPSSFSSVASAPPVSSPSFCFAAAPSPPPAPPFPMAPRIKMFEYNIPFHIQEEIMKRLPVKSLIQFRSVSKAWNSLIDSSAFIAAHSLHSHTQTHHLLVSYFYQYAREEGKYVCFDDDDTFLQHWSVPTLPLSLKKLVFQNIVGSSHGLVCFYCHKTKLVAIWNPSVRKSILVAVPCKPFDVAVGFGVCPVTSDPKIVAVTQSWDKENIETSYECEVMVYTLSSGEWRSLFTNLPTKPFLKWCSAVAVDGFIYWSSGLQGHNMITSFDLTNETFQMTDLPSTLAHHGPLHLHIYKPTESLAILQYDRNTYTYTVWKMEVDVQRSFTKLFFINTPCRIKAFRKSGVPILEVTEDFQSKLVVDEPNSVYNNGNPNLA